MALGNDTNELSIDKAPISTSKILGSLANGAVNTAQSVIDAYNTAGKLVAEYAPGVPLDAIAEALPGGEVLGAAVRTVSYAAFINYAVQTTVTPVAAQTSPTPTPTPYVLCSSLGVKDDSAVTSRAPAAFDASATATPPPNPPTVPNICKTHPGELIGCQLNNGTAITMTCPGGTPTPTPTPSATPTATPTATPSPLNTNGGGLGWWWALIVLGGLGVAVGGVGACAGAIYWWRKQQARKKQDIAPEEDGIDKALLEGSGEVDRPVDSVVHRPAAAEEELRIEDRPPSP